MSSIYDTVRYSSLEGRAVLITGGASGIGAEMVKAFAAQGAKVSFIDIDETEGTKVAIATGAAFFACDITDIPALCVTIAPGTMQLTR
ncbi:MAG: SDR family NAD(P)-dependent oxidoreductase, partial [Pararhizobium sp.]